jgi:hypothetical protein
LNWGGRPFFSFVGEVILPDGYPDEPNLWKTKTGDPNFRTAGQTFSPPITRSALEFSHSLALQVTQRPAFVLEDNIGDRAVFSGLVKAGPIASTIDVMLDDGAAYASHAAHFGSPPPG